MKLITHTLINSKFDTFDNVYYQKFSQSSIFNNIIWTFKRLDT